MKKSVLLSLMIFLISCDCHQEIKGIVVDGLTSKPLAGVLIRNLEKGKSENETTTDSTGSFKLSSISGGLTGCPAMVIYSYKMSYKGISDTVPSGGQIEIRMERDK